MKYIGKRISVVKTDEEFSVVISAASTKRPAYFLFFWLICWASCGIVIIPEYRNTENENFKVFIIVFSFFWLYFFIRSLYSFFWKLYGMEIIKIKQGKFFVRRAVKSWGKVHVYDSDFMKDIRVRALNPHSVMNAISSADWLENREMLAFDYYGKEIRFGYNLREEEAKELLKMVKHHLRSS